MTLANSFSTSTRGVDQVQFANGVVWGRAELQSAYLARAQTAGNDIIQGFDSNTASAVQALAGHDTIVARAAGDDRLVFGASLASTDVLVTRSANGYDAKMTFAGSAGSLTLKDEFWGGGWGVEQVRFGDGVVWGRAELLNACIA